MSRSRARERRLAAAAAAKQRRKLFVAVGLVGMLAVLLVIQGPRMLGLFGGGEEAAPPPPTPTAPATTTPVTPPAQPSGATRDPFAAQRLVSADPAPRAVGPPAGLRDPFAPATGGPAAPTSAPPSSARKSAPAAPASPLPNQIVLGKPGANAKARKAWIVVLASIPTGSGRGVAEQFAARSRREGLTSIGVLESSSQRPLRSGYFVVYNGPYTTLAAVQRAAAHVHAFGYRTAYIREILRY